MNSPGAGRRTPKRRRTTTKSLSRLLDLNSPPSEGAGEGVSFFRISPFLHNEASSSMTVQLNQASSSIPPATDEPHIGMHTCPIDVEAIDDDVVIYSSTTLPQVCSCALFLCLFVVIIAVHFQFLHDYVRRNTGTGNQIVCFYVSGKTTIDQDGTYYCDNR